MVYYKDMKGFGDVCLSVGRDKQTRMVSDAHFVCLSVCEQSHCLDLHLL